MRAVTEATRRKGDAERRRWVAAFVLLITILERETSFMPWEMFLPLLVAFALAVLWWVSDRLLSTGELLAAAALVAASLGIAAIPFILSRDLSGALRVSVTLPSVVAGAVVALLLLARQRERPAEQIEVHVAAGNRLESRAHAAAPSRSLARASLK